MKISIALPVMIAVGFVIPACQGRSPAAFSEQDEARVRGTFDTTLTTIRAGDWAAWAAQFSVDAAFHPPNEPAVSGRDAIQRWGEALDPVGAIDFQNVRVSGSGNLAYGTSGYTFITKGSPPDTGKQLAVFERDSTGTWKVVAVSFNSNLPAPAPTESTKPAND